MTGALISGYITLGVLILGISADIKTSTPWVRGIAIPLMLGAVFAFGWCVEWLILMGRS